MAKIVRLGIALDSAIPVLTLGCNENTFNYRTSDVTYSDHAWGAQKSDLGWREDLCMSVDDEDEAIIRLLLDETLNRATVFGGIP